MYALLGMSKNHDLVVGDHRGEPKEEMNRGW